MAHRWVSLQLALLQLCQNTCRRAAAHRWVSLQLALELCYRAQRGAQVRRRAGLGRGWGELLILRV